MIVFYRWGGAFGFRGESQKNQWSLKLQTKDWLVTVYILISHE